MKLPIVSAGIAAAALLGCSSSNTSSAGSNLDAGSKAGAGGAISGSGGAGLTGQRDGGATGGTTSGGGASSGSGGVSGNGGGTGGASGAQCQTSADCPQLGCYMCPASVCVNGQCITGSASGGSGGTGGRAGTGGSAGGGGSAAESCSQLEMDYGQALTPAQNCDSRATVQCQHVVAAALGCYCTIHVNDASTLNDIQARYDRAGCPTNTCAGVACVNPGTGTCTPINRGDVCQ